MQQKCLRNNADAMKMHMKSMYGSISTDFYRNQLLWQLVTKTYPRLRRFNRCLLYFNEWSGTVLNKERKNEMLRESRFRSLVVEKRTAFPYGLIRSFFIILSSRDIR